MSNTTTSGGDSRLEDHANKTLVSTVTNEAPIDVPVICLIVGEVVVLGFTLATLDVVRKAAITEHVVYTLIRIALYLSIIISFVWIIGSLIIIIFQPNITWVVDSTIQAYIVSSMVAVSGHDLTWCTIGWIRHFRIAKTAEWAEVDMEQLKKSCIKVICMLSGIPFAMAATIRIYYTLTYNEHNAFKWPNSGILALSSVIMCHHLLISVFSLWIYTKIMLRRSSPVVQPHSVEIHGIEVTVAWPNPVAQETNDIMRVAKCGLLTSSLIAISHTIVSGVVVTFILLPVGSADLAIYSLAFMKFLEKFGVLLVPLSNFKVISSYLKSKLTNCLKSEESEDD